MLEFRVSSVELSFPNGSEPDLYVYEQDNRAMQIRIMVSLISVLFLVVSLTPEIADAQRTRSARAKVSKKAKKRSKKPSKKGQASAYVPRCSTGKGYFAGACRSKKWLTRNLLGADERVEGADRKFKASYRSTAKLT
jgi:hypothetical protein